MNLGQPSSFTEASLQAKLAELASVRAEIVSTEAQIQSIRTGVPIQTAAAPAALPGGSVDLPVIGQVPTLAIAGVVMAGAFFASRKRK